jgi:protein-disulfide isomerase
MYRSLASIALALALAVPAGAEGLTDMTEAERAAFGEAVRDYLLENPEVIVEAMTILQDQQAAAEAASDEELVATNAAAIFADGFSWVGGNPAGDITIVEFMDYRCGYCKKAHAEVDELVKSDGNIRLIYKEFPILGEESMTTSRFAIAVQQLHGADAYKAVHDGLMELRGAPDDAALSRLASDLNFDPAAILERMNSEEVTAVIAANRSLAEILAVSGTPTFVMGGQMLRGYVPLESMMEIVAQERAG